MPILMIGAPEREEIQRVIAEARAHPVPMSTVVNSGTLDHKNVLKLRDRKPGFKRRQTACVLLPVGYRTAFSIEEQPIGMCSHLSISVYGRSRPGVMPSPESVRMIADEFGVPFPPRTFWMEEFEPGEFAVNLVSLESPGPGGAA